jgi:hypothetical protein
VSEQARASSPCCQRTARTFAIVCHAVVRVQVQQHGRNVCGEAPAPRRVAPDTLRVRPRARLRDVQQPRPLGVLCSARAAHARLCGRGVGARAILLEYAIFLGVCAAMLLLSMCLCSERPLSDEELRGGALPRERCGWGANFQYGRRATSNGFRYGAIAGFALSAVILAIIAAARRSGWSGCRGEAGCGRHGAFDMVTTHALLLRGFAVAAFVVSMATCSERPVAVPAITVRPALLRPGTAVLRWRLARAST